MSVFTVTVSPSLDYYMQTDGLTENAVNRASDCHYKVGGKGINAARTLKNLGMEAVSIGFIAGFVGKEIERLAEADGLLTDFIKLESGNSRINVKIADNKNGDCQMTEINAASPEINAADCEKLFAKMRNAGSGDFVIFSGSEPAGSRIYKTAAEICKKNGAKIVVDCDGGSLRDLLTVKPFLIKPNHIEFCALCGAKTTDDRETLINILRETFPNAENVLVSMGDKGALLASENEEITYCPVEAVPAGAYLPPINTVGAGDTMLAAFLNSYIKTGGDREKSLEFAVRTATNYVTGDSL
jgi:1-phosphofructokinase